MHIINLIMVVVVAVGILVVIPVYLLIGKYALRLAGWFIALMWLMLDDARSDDVNFFSNPVWKLFWPFALFFGVVLLLVITIAGVAARCYTGYKVVLKWCWK